MKKQKKNITDFVKRTYKACFDMKLDDSWAPHTVFKTCVETLCGWTNGTNSLERTKI